MNAMQAAFDNASGKKTPWNPSRKAISRVRNPLPAPTVCPHCGSQVKIVGNEQIYGKPYGDWPWVYMCDGNFCDAYVGLHPFTNIPLGTLATHAMRDARKRAKAAFKPMYESKRMTRTQAYAWLAEKLGIVKVEECHIGWFDVETCNRVIEVCQSRTDK